MQTIGERLEEARKRKGVSIREAAEATKIRGDYLQKFEANQFDIELAEIYVRGFLRNYSHFLKLAPDRVLGDYEALGRGKARSRQPSREVYGRMDLSISSAEEREEAASSHAKAPAERTEAQPAEPARPGPALSRTGSSLPKTPAVDPALVFKAGVALAAVLAVLLIVLLIKSILFGGRSPEAHRPPAAAPVSAPAAAPSLTLIALDTVRVSVTERDTGQVLQPETTLAPGQRLPVSRPGPVLVQADVGANLQVEINGKRWAIPAGSNRAIFE